MPLFTVVIPVFNRTRLLKATLSTLQKQRFGDFETIIVDDGSTESVEDVLKDVDLRVTLLRLPANLGQPSARNRGIQHASGEFIAFLDSDDLWFPWTLETYRQAIVEAGNISFGAGSACAVMGSEESKHTEVKEFSCAYYDDYLSYRSHSPEWWFVPSMAFARAELLREVGGFWSDRLQCEDVDLWQRLGTASRFAKIDSPVTCGYRLHAESATLKFPSMAEGVCTLIAKERHGCYPGGDSRQRDRIRVISAHARHHARELADSFHFASGWRLYWQAFWWNLMLGRWRFLAGFPMLSGTRLLQRFHRQVIKNAQMK